MSMSFFEFLRSAFLPPRQHHENDYFFNRPQDPVWDRQDEDEEDEFFGPEFRGSGSRPFGFDNFNIFSGDIMEMHKYFEQQLEDMMRNFANFETFRFDSGTFDDGNFGGQLIPPKLPEQPSLPAHPQERYLKPHFDTSSSTKRDTDLDSQLEQEGLDSVLSADQYKKQIVPKSNFSSQSHSTRVFIGPNGHMERQETVKKPDGGTSTTITRRIDDKEHSFTTNTTPEGIVTTDENFVNLDENSLLDFNKVWSGNVSPHLDSSPTPDKFHHDLFKPPPGFFDSVSKFFKW